MGYRVAVVGATGNVGREFLELLAERNFPADDVVALASEKSAGRKVSFGDKDTLTVRDLAKFDFKGIDLVLSSPGAKVSAVSSPRAAKAGADRDRQHVVLPHGSGRAAGGAGGQRLGHRRLPQAQHHRQSQLLDHPDGDGAEAAARLRAYHAHRGGDLPVDLGRRQGSDGRAVQPDQGHLRQRHADAVEIQQADRLQRHSPYRLVHGRRADQGRVEDDGGDQEDSWIPPSR